jgi:hypothetical protein
MNSAIATDPPPRSSLLIAEFHMTTPLADLVRSQSWRAQWQFPSQKLRVARGPHLIVNSPEPMKVIVGVAASPAP